MHNIFFVIRLGVPKVSANKYTNKRTNKYANTQILRFITLIYIKTVRPVLSYRYECWATKETDELKFNVAELRMLRWMYGVTRKDKMRYKSIRESMKIALATEKLKRD